MQTREELAPPDVPRKYEHKEALVGLCRCVGGEGSLPCSTLVNLFTPDMSAGTLRAMLD